MGVKGNVNAKGRELAACQQIFNAGCLSYQRAMHVISLSYGCTCQPNVS